MADEPKETKKEKPAPKSNTALIIIIIVIVILILGVGGYFAWKYFLKAKFTKITNPTTTSTTKNASEFTLSQLEEMIKYPNGTLTSTDHSKAAGYTSVLQMETNDSIVTANNYYLSLNSAQKWTITAKSLESDNSRADITLEGAKDKFTVYIIIDSNGEKTEILLRIDAEDLPVGTPLGTNSTTTPSTKTPTTTAPSSTSTDTSQKTLSNDYVITDSDTRVISQSELTGFSPWELKVARNEIYARHGRPFVHKDLQCYFAKQSWYKIDSNFSESMLSVVENKNVATIKAYEEKINSPLLQKDSGCGTN
jgi:hypothetical protein